MAALSVGAVWAQALDGVTFKIPPDLSSQEPRVAAATGATLSLLRDWFGPLPSGTVTVTGMPWQGSDHGISMPGVVAVPMRLFAPVRDQSLERSLIFALSAQYWQGGSSPSFQDALTAYSGTRAIHQILEGSNFAAPRFFGGHVSFPLRSVLLSPPVGDPRPRVWGFDGSMPVPETVRRLRALQAIERYVGWPTMLEAVASMRAAGPSNWTESTLGETLSTMMGIDVRPIVRECLSRGVDCPSAPTEPVVNGADHPNGLDSPRSRLGVRLALHWLAWLQNAILSYTAVV